MSSSLPTPREAGATIRAGRRQMRTGSRLILAYVVLFGAGLLYLMWRFGGA